MTLRLSALRELGIAMKSPFKKQTMEAKNIYPCAFPTFNPAADDIRSELEHLREEIESKAIESINWYLQRKITQGRYSRRLRFAAICLTSLGGLMPIFQAVYSQATNMAQMGYVSLALAAACVGFDKFFGFSSAWIRYMTTEIALQRDLSEFQMDWLILKNELGNKEPDQRMRKRMLYRLKLFRIQMLEKIIGEMQVWVAEFHSNLLQLEHTAHATSETQSQPPTVP